MDNRGYIVELESEKGIKKSEKYESSTPTHPSHTFEEAISLIPMGKFHYFLVLVGGFCFMYVMVEIMCVSMILPSMKCDLVSTISEQSMLASSGFFGIVLSSHAMGFLADTWGRVKMLRVALILSMITSIISAFSVNIWMLTVFRFFTGFFVAGGQACVFTLAGEFHGNRTRTRHVTILSVFLPLAVVYLPTIALWILPIQIDTVIMFMKFSSWRVLLLSNSFLGLLTLVGFFLLPETPKYILSQGDNKRALEILQWVFVKNTGRPASEYPVKLLINQDQGASLSNIRNVKDALKMIWSQTIPLFYRERVFHTLNICFVQFFFYGISQGVFMWFPTILNEMVAIDGIIFTVCSVIGNLGSDASMTSDVCSGQVDTFPFLVIILVGSAFSVFFIFFSFTIDYVGKKNLILIWLILASICVTLLHWTTNFYLIIILFTLTMSIGNCGGLVSTISMEFFPTNINAMGMCFIMMIGRLGAVVGSNILGHLLFNYCDMVLWGFMAVNIMLFMCCTVLPERKYSAKKKSIHDVQG